MSKFLSLLIFSVNVALLGASVELAAADASAVKPVLPVPEPAPAGLVNALGRISMPRGASSSARCPPATTRLWWIPPGGRSTVRMTTASKFHAILAGMLLPAIIMVRKAVKSTSCKKNLRQVAVAHVGYSNDNEGMTMSVCDYGTWFNSWCTRSVFLESWTDQPGVTQATMPVKMLCAISKPRANPASPATGLSYGMNILVTVWTQITTSVGHSSGDPVTFSFASLTNPSNLVTFADALYPTLSYGGADPSNTVGHYWATGTPAVEGTLVNASAAFRHQSLSNVIFYDGHVAAMPPLTLYDSTL